MSRQSFMRAFGGRTPAQAYFETLLTPEGVKQSIDELVDRFQIKNSIRMIPGLAIESVGRLSIALEQDRDGALSILREKAPTGGSIRRLGLIEAKVPTLALEEKTLASLTIGDFHSLPGSGQGFGFASLNRFIASMAVFNEAQRVLAPASAPKPETRVERLVRALGNPDFRASLENNDDFKKAIGSVLADFEYHRKSRPEEPS